jgi:hypothetical protein
MMGSYGQLTGSVNDERVGMELEQSELVAGQSVEKSKITSLQKEISRSATRTSRVAKKSTSISATATMESIMDDARVGMELEESQPDWKARRDGSSLIHTAQNKEQVARSASRTSTSTTTTTGMQKIDEGNEEEEEILGLKTRSWRKINVSFAINLKGQEGEDIRGTDYYNEGNNKIK